MRDQVHVVILLLSLAGCGQNPGTATDGLVSDRSAAPDRPAFADGRRDLGCGPVAAAELRDLAYTTIAGVDPTLLSLDLYTPALANRCTPAPVVVWVHGGGWAIGDKGNKIDAKRALFTGAGYLFASVNYRLSPNPPAPSDPSRVRHPTHVQDLAAALAFLEMTIATHGGDPKRIAVLGHSAGAHLVALASTDESYLASKGSRLGSVRCTGSLDTEGYDIPTALATASASEKAIYKIPS